MLEFRKTKNYTPRQTHSNCLACLSELNIYFTSLSRLSYSTNVNQLKNVKQLGKKDQFNEIIIFDRQKPLPLPHIPTKIMI